MAAHLKHIWSFGGKKAKIPGHLHFSKKFQHNSAMHLDFKTWLQIFLLNISFGDMEIYYSSVKLNIQKTKIMASGPITSWEIDGETVEAVSDFIWGAPKSLQMVTAAMKLKDAYSLEGKLWPT